MVLIARFLAGWRGRKAQLISMVGITFMLAGHLGLGAFTQTKHRLSYSEAIRDEAVSHER